MWHLDLCFPSNKDNCFGRWLYLAQPWCTNERYLTWCCLTQFAGVYNHGWNHGTISVIVGGRHGLVLRIAVCFIYQIIKYDGGKAGKLPSEFKFLVAFGRELWPGKLMAGSLCT
jgi:hypothetical protein